MNDTRKQIIELIEPYMDKTLSEGCLILQEDWSIIRANHMDNDSIYDAFVGAMNLKKILGHYDITTVLKYIWNRWEMRIWKVGLEAHRIIIRTLWNWIQEIPNKPLHLYTEQEEKHLLKLLQKLWAK